MHKWTRPVVKIDEQAKTDTAIYRVRFEMPRFGAKLYRSQKKYEKKKKKALSAGQRIFPHILQRKKNDSDNVHTVQSSIIFNSPITHRFR